MSTKNVDLFLLAEKRQHKSVERLKKARKDRELNQQDVANELEKDRTTISNWERGKATPTIDDFIKLSVLYKKPIDYLIALDVVRNKVSYDHPEVSAVNEEINEIEYELLDLVGKELPRGANLEALRSSVKLIQSFVESFEKIRNDRSDD